MTDTLVLLCGLIQNDLALTDGHVFIFNQKVDPKVLKDPGVFVCAQYLGTKTVGQNPTYRFDGVQYWEDRATNISQLVQLDVFSRNTDAMTAYIQVMACLNGQTGNEMQQSSAMSIQRNPDVNNLSDPDGEAIPYRFVITMRVSRLWTQSVPALWYDHGFVPSVITNP